jgi:hypothetical protein
MTRLANPKANPFTSRSRHGPGVACLALGLFLPLPLAAQIIPTGTPAADVLLSQAIAEHRVFLTCSALDPQLHALILQNWQRDTAAATAILTAQNVPLEAISAFTTAARPENLMPADDTPWAEVKGLCATQADWLNTYQEFDVTILELKLPRAFQ